MDYSEIITVLDKACAFDLYRLRTALDHMIDDPRRIIEVKSALRLGQTIQYFEANRNRVFEAVVEQVKQTRVVVRDTVEGRRWDIPLCAINIRHSDVRIEDPQRQGLTKVQVQVGDLVGFMDRSNIERAGTVVRLNQKTVTVESEEGSWRVSYLLLYKVVEVQGAN